MIIMIIKYSKVNTYRYRQRFISASVETFSHRSALKKEISSIKIYMSKDKSNSDYFINSAEIILLQELIRL